MSNKPRVIEVHGLTVRDKYYKVDLDWHGKFTATVNGSVVESTTRSGLEEAIKRMTKEKHITVSYPFCAFDREEVIRGVATGVHTGNGNVIVKWEGGKTEQINAYHRSSYMRNLTATEVTKLKKLSAAYSKVEHEFVTFKDSLNIDLLNEVRAEIAKANPEKEDDSA